MGLGLTTAGSGGEIVPFIKYDAKAGRLFRIDRVQGSDGSYSSNNVEVTNTARFIADMENIRVGWINYTAQGPVRRLAILGKEPIPPQPQDKNAEGKYAFKQGFEIRIAMDTNSGGPGGNVARVFGSTAGCVIEALDALHDAYLAAPEAKTGKLPIVAISGVEPIKSKQSTNYKPTFAIQGWADRPAALVEETATQPGGGTGGAPSTGSTTVGAPQPAAASSRDFG